MSALVRFKGVVDRVGYPTLLVFVSIFSVILTLALVHFTPTPSLLAVVIGVTAGYLFGVNVTRLSNSLDQDFLSQMLAVAIKKSETVPVLILDTNGIIHSANEASVILSGCSEAELIGTTFWTQLLPEQDHESAKIEFKQYCCASEQVQSDGQWVTSFGEAKQIAWSHQCIEEDNTVKWITLVGHDITVQRQIEAQMQTHFLNEHEYSVELELQRQELFAANEKLAEIAKVDGLTGLYNHRTFQEVLEGEFGRCSSSKSHLSVLLMDVDRFKSYNDTFGHPAGDEALRRVANIIQSTIRDTDCAARYGGEEFGVILPGADAKIAKRVAERIRKAAEEEPWPLRPITLSIGVSVFDHDIDTPTQIVELADRALYQSKESGRNKTTIFGTPELELRTDEFFSDSIAV